MNKFNFFKKNHKSYLNIKNEEFCLGKGDLSTSKESFAFYSGLEKRFNYLVFFDSRGAKTNQTKVDTTINLLKDYFKKLNLSYLIVSRPLNLTIIPTLLSFCENTFIKFDNILTNVGFVDTTPKKKDVLCDIKYQLDNTNLDYTYQYLCDFELFYKNLI